MTTVSCLGGKIIKKGKEALSIKIGIIINFVEELKVSQIGDRIGAISYVQ